MVTDLVMPDMGGLELLAYKDRYYPRIKSIIITSHGTEELQKNAANDNALSYLEKPLDYNKLGWAIMDAIDSLDEGRLFAKLSVPSLLQQIGRAHV